MTERHKTRGIGLSAGHAYKRGNFMKKRVAAVILVFTLLLSSCGPDTRSLTNRGGISESPDSRFMLAEATYPEAVKKVSSMDKKYIGADGVWKSDLYDEDQAAWTAHYSQQRTAAEGLPERLKAYNTTVLSGILSNTEGKTRVFSPVNLYVALAMLSECAENKTEKELLSLLNVSDGAEAADTAKKLFDANFVDNGELLTTFSNSLWMRQGAAYREETIHKLTDLYYADVFEGDPADPAYEDALKTWLNAHTMNLLDQTVEGLKMDPEMMLSLVSTLSFRGKWQYPFEPDRTKKGLFHGREGDTQAEFMRMDTEDSFYFFDHFSAIRRLISGNDFMWFILPDEGFTPEEIASEEDLAALLSGMPYEALNGHMKHCEIHLSIPKFDVFSEIDLRKDLENIGIHDAFDPGSADFSGVFSNAPKGTALSDIKHAARVSIDEEGITATAFTLEELCGAAMPEDTVEFVLDRPFLFGITSYTDTLLFAGIVNTIE